MANIEDCPGFETFGSDVKAARQAKRISRKAMAEKVNIEALSCQHRKRGGHSQPAGYQEAMVTGTLAFKVSLLV